MIHPVVIYRGQVTSSISRNPRSDKYIYVPLETPLTVQFLEETMPTKTPTEPTTVTPVTEEFKDQNQKYNLSKFEFDLYHEEYDVAEKVIRVKRVSMPNKGEKWKVFEDNKVIFTIEGTKISKKEREYLQTVEGFNFMLAQAKLGIKSLNGFRTELKKVMNKKPDKAAAPKPKRSKK